MKDLPLAGLRVLVVEDEYFLADELKHTLVEAGAGMVRLSGEFLDAMREVENDGYAFALLDINLHGEMAYAVADILLKTGVPFGFVTGYSTRDLPPRFARVPCWEKPISHRGLVRDIERAWLSGTGG